MYRPNFCSDCGSRIEIARWRPWNNRRFCSSCAPRLRKAQFMPPLLGGIALFVLGLFAGRGARPAPPPLIVEPGQIAAIESPLSKKEDRTTRIEREGDASEPQPESISGRDGTSTEKPTEPGETISICGARTQKGSPCQRRVRGTGRCWQHRGAPAILPPGKLIIGG